MELSFNDVYGTRVIFKGDKLVRVIRTPVDDVSSFNNFLPLIPVDFKGTPGNYGDVNVVLSVLMHGKNVAGLLEVVNRTPKISKMDRRRLKHHRTAGGALGSVESAGATTSIQLSVASSQ